MSQSWQWIELYVRARGPYVLWVRLNDTDTEVGARGNDGECATSWVVARLSGGEYTPSLIAVALSLLKG